MRNALIDIGSNTIRLAIYDNMNEIKNYADYAGLISHVSGGTISAEGIGKLVRALTVMKKMACELECDNIYAFATASLRDINDKPELISFIRVACGLEIEIISGTREAEYDYAGLKAMENINSGMAFDLGGGSCQLMVFKDDKVSDSISLPIGSLKLHRDFVSRTLPDNRESHIISEYVADALASFKGVENFCSSCIYAMGGAVFALTALSKKYVSNSDTLCMCDLENICKLNTEQINSVVPKRLNTVIPAALTMIEILKISKCTEIIPTKAGVRDGILYDKFLKYSM